MKTFQSSKALPRLAAIAAVFAAGSALVPTVASANTAANTTIRNTVYVDYADASAVAQPQISDEADVVVQLVAATPSLNAPADQTIAPSSTATYNYTVTSNANGPDTYNLSTTVGTENNLSGSTANTSVASVTLGATTVAVAPGAITANTPTAITVPSDTTGSSGAVNDIASGDVVVISGVRCDVTAINDVGTALTGAITNSTITVDCDSGISPGIGAVIGEQQTFDTTVDPNGWTAPNTGDVTVTTSAQDALADAAAATDDTLTTVEQLLVVTKYVRNVLNAAGNAGGAGSVTVGGNTYYASGVVGVPGDTLEYLIEVENTSAGNDATDVVISDAVPAFTTLVTTSLDVLDNSGTSVGAANDTADDGDQGEVVSNTVYLYPGDALATLGNDTATGGGNVNGDGGTVGAGNFAYGVFQVTVD